MKTATSEETVNVGGWTTESLEDFLKQKLQP